MYNFFKFSLNIEEEAVAKRVKALVEIILSDKNLNLQKSIFKNFLELPSTPIEEKKQILHEMKNHIINSIIQDCESQKQKLNEDLINLGLNVDPSTLEMILTGSQKDAAEYAKYSNSGICCLYISRRCLSGAECLRRIPMPACFNISPAVLLYNIIICSTHL